MAKLKLPDLRALAGGASNASSAGDSFLMRRGPTFANIALVVLAAWLGTTWFWHFWPQDGAPAAGAAVQRVRPTVSAAALGETVAGARLFGQGAQAVTASDPGAQAVSTLNVKLKGVFATRGKDPGSAIVNNGQKDEFVAIGAEVLPGVVLDQVYPTHVVLRRGGQLERVNLEERIAAGGGAPGMPRSAPSSRAPMFVPSVPSVPSVPPPSLPPTIPPPGFAGDNKAPPPIPNIPPPANVPPGVPGVPPMPGGAPQAGIDLGRFTVSANGLTIEDVPRDGPLARAGLQPGDVVKSVNGQAVSSESDIMRLAQLTATGQSVRGEILRDGKTVPIRIRAN